jgi:hypothetical protein
MIFMDLLAIIALIYCCGFPGILAYLLLKIFKNTNKKTKICKECKI